MLLVAISIGYCCCELAHDCHGDYYNESISLDELRRILNGEAKFPTQSPVDMMVAQLLAQAEDKDQELYGGVTTSDLLQLTRDYPDLRFCNRKQFESFDSVCHQVSQNQYLAQFCKKRIAELLFRCKQNAFTQFRDYIGNWSDHEELVELIKEVSANSEKHGNPWDSKKRAVDDYLQAAWIADERQNKLVELCTGYYLRMDEYILYFDKNADIAFRSLKQDDYRTETLILNYCTAIGRSQMPEVD